MIPAEQAASQAPARTSASRPKDEQPPWLLRVYCFLLTALPTYVILPGALKGNGSPARLSALIMFGLVALSFVMVRRTGERRRVNPGAVILLIYFAFGLLTYGAGALNIDGYAIASSRTRALMGLVAQVGVGLYIIARTHTARQRDVLLGWLAAGLGFACLVGFLQGVSSIDLQLLLRPPGFILNREESPAFERLGVTRVTGTSQHPIEFSVLAAVTIPLMLYFTRNAATRGLRTLAGFGCVVALLALPAAVSRSGIISLLVAMLIYMFAFKIRSIAIALAATAAAIGIYSAIFPNVFNALWSTITGSAKDASVESRIDAIAKVSDAFHEHPIFGLGLGGATPDVFGYLDNQWLQAIVQGGLVGLVGMVLFSVGMVFGISAALRGAAPGRDREQGYMLGAMGIGILASSFTFDLFAFQQAAALSFVVFSLLWSGFNVPVRDPDRSQSQPMDAFS